MQTRTPGNDGVPSIGDTKRRAWFFMAMLAALMALTSLSTDVYLPAMPQMRVDLQADVELTITGFLIGCALPILGSRRQLSRHPLFRHPLIGRLRSEPAPTGEIP